MVILGSGSSCAQLIARRRVYHVTAASSSFLCVLRASFSIRRRYVQAPHFNLRPYKGLLCHIHSHNGNYIRIKICCDSSKSSFGFNAIQHILELDSFLVVVIAQSYRTFYFGEVSLEIIISFCNNGFVEMMNTEKSSKQRTDDPET